MLLLTLALLLGPADSTVVRDVEVAHGETLRTTSIGIGNGQPIVLIPGIFGAAFGYRKITRPLVARGYRTIVIEPLGYGWSSRPKNADYSFDAQTERVARALDRLGVKQALLVAQSSGAAIAFRLAIQRPDLVRGLLSIDGGPAETAATPGMKKAFKLGGFMTKLAMDESRLRHEVRKEIVRNSGDTTWVTAAVIRAYTAGQNADLNGSIDAFQRMSKSKEGDSLAGRLHRCEMPVRLLVGTVPHPAEVTRDQRELLRDQLPDFKSDSVTGSGQYIHEEQPLAVLAAVAELDQATAAAGE
ncbi:MAG: alpha/beta hydrolase [Gemmatimonadales bacterium]|nr:alpha/beta hydrolase [Gemmatimonadales bacterium]